MNCVLITLTYPYGNGDPFLMDEIPIIAQYFEHVYILPIIRGYGLGETLPKNASLINSNVCKLAGVANALAKLGKVIEDVRFGCKNGYTNLPKMFHRAFMYEVRSYESLRALRKCNVDDCIFYAYWLSEPAYVLARYKMQHKKAICVSRAHGYDCFKDRGYNPFRREIAENIDIIYSISKKGKEDLEKNLAPLARNSHQPIVKVSHLGVSVGEEMNPISRDPSLFRIVTCSSVVQIKRLDIMAQAIKQVKSGEKTIEWIHFGDGELLERLKQQVSECGIPKNKRVRFMGNTKHRDILMFYAKTPIDLFVNCSDAEGIPVSIMEAMGYGIPCIARDVGGISEIIDNNENGFLLPSEPDSMLLAQKIEELMDKGIPEEMRLNARHKIQVEFTNRHNYHKYAQELIQLLGHEGVKT